METGSQLHLRHEPADCHGACLGGVGGERHRAFAAHEQPVGRGLLRVEADDVPHIGEPVVVDTVREGDGRRDVGQHHQLLRSGEQSGNRLGKDRRSEGMLLVQRTVGIENEHRDVMHAVSAAASSSCSGSPAGATARTEGSCPFSVTGKGGRRVRPRGPCFVSPPSQAVIKNTIPSSPANTARTLPLPEWILSSWQMILC